MWNKTPALFTLIFFSKTKRSWWLIFPANVISQLFTKFLNLLCILCYRLKWRLNEGIIYTILYFSRCYVVIYLSFFWNVMVFEFCHKSFFWCLWSVLISWCFFCSFAVLKKFLDDYFDSPVQISTTSRNWKQLRLFVKNTF